MLEALLALALTAGGILIGTQLRMAYLAAAGGSFPSKHSRAALGAGGAALLALVAVAVLQAPEPVHGLLVGLPIALLLAPLAMTTAQSPPVGSSGFGVRHRDVVLGISRRPAGGICWH